MDVRDEAKAAGKRVVAVGIATATMALMRWIVSRPIKRAIAARRAKKENDDRDRDR